MRIGFDAKRAYHNNTGLGNYSRDLIRGLANKYREDQYVLFTPTVSRNPRSAFINYFPNITPIAPSSLFDKSLKSVITSLLYTDISPKEKTMKKAALDFEKFIKNCQI